MARTLLVLDVFLSSPSDVSPERQLIADVAREWNILHSKSRGIHINILTWEDVVTPALGERSQAVINEQIGDEYDVFIGLMWSRFGSSTGVADSGTVEEFERALNRYRGGEALRLAMMFKSADIPTSVLDGEQYAKVQAFKKVYANEGGMYREFHTAEELRIIIHKLFNQIADNKNTKIHNQPSIILPELVRSNSENKIHPDIEELGLIEVRQLIEGISESQGNFLSGWTKLMSDNSELTGKTTDDLEAAARIGIVDPLFVNEKMKDLARSLDKISDYIEVNLPSYAERNDELAKLIAAAIDLSSDFPDDTGQEEWKIAARVLMTSVRENHGSTHRLNGSLNEIPRLSGILNKSKNRIVRANNRMIEENIRLERMLGEFTNQDDS